jgi:hypothetical protein
MRTLKVVLVLGSFVISFCLVGATLVVTSLKMIGFPLPIPVALAPVVVVGGIGLLTLLVTDSKAIEERKREDAEARLREGAEERLRKYFMTKTER